MGPTRATCSAPWPSARPDRVAPKLAVPKFAKKSKKSGVKSGAGKVNHPSLNTMAREFGRLASHRVPKGGVFRLKNPPAHRENYFADLIEELNKTKADAITAGKFNDRYRELLDHHDELVSTSTIREIVFGILEGHKKKPLSADEVAEVDRVLDNVSRIRLPTELVGYSTSAESMQHPTSPGAGYFANDHDTRAKHYQHDLARKCRFLDAVDHEIKTNQHWTLESAINAGVREAIAYTLNEMAAPITAADIKPHSLKKNVLDAELTPDVRLREDMKTHFVALGGLQESSKGPPRLNRPWTQRRGNALRSVSPPRFPADP